MHPNNQACLLVQDLIEQTDQTISDIASMCEERNMHLPAFTTAEEANDFAANLTNILVTHLFTIDHQNRKSLCAHRNRM